MAKKCLIGLGLDARDGHTRVTRGEEFFLIGGSRQTHLRMQETAIRIQEHVRKKGKTLSQIESKEFLDIAHKIGLQPIPD